VDRDEIGKYYDRADIFINASRLDNMPVSILEAFASGTPVVSTAPEGMRYLVEHGRTGLCPIPATSPHWRRTFFACCATRNYPLASLPADTINYVNTAGTQCGNSG